MTTGALVATLGGHTNYVYGLSFSRDGRLASSSWDGSVIVWDVATSKPRVRLSTSSRTRLWGVGFSADGSKVAAATRDGVLVIWDAESGDELQRFDGGADVLTSLAFNEDSSLVAAGTASGPIRLFHLARLRDFRGRLTSIGFGSATDRVVGAFEEDPAAAARRSSRPDDHHSMLWNILDGSAMAAFGDAVHQSGERGGGRDVTRRPLRRHGAATKPRACGWLMAGVWRLLRRRHLRPRGARACTPMSFERWRSITTGSAGRGHGWMGPRGERVGASRWSLRRRRC